MKYLAPFILIVVGLCVGCRRDSAADFLLAEADSLRFSDPEMALQVLAKVDTGRMDTEQSARYGVLLTHSMFRARRPVEDEDLIERAYDYYENRESSPYNGWAHYCLSLISQANGGNDSLTIDHARKFLKCAQTVNDYYMAFYSNYNLGTLFEVWFPGDSARYYLGQAADLAKERGDTMRYIVSKIGIGRTHIRGHNMEAARKEFATLLPLTDKWAEYKAEINMLYARTYYHEEKYDSALVYFDKAERTMKEIIHYGDSLNIYMFKGATLLKTGNYDEAVKYIEKGKDTTTLVGHGIYHLNRCRLAEARGDYAGALGEHKLYSAMNDSVNRRALAARALRWKMILDRNEVAAERDRLQLVNARKDMCIGLLIFALTMIAVALAWVRTRRARKRTEIDMARQDVVMQSSADAQQSVCAASQADVDQLRDMLMRTDEIIMRIRHMAETAPGNYWSVNPDTSMRLSPAEVEHIGSVIDLCYPGFNAGLSARANRELKPEEVTLCRLVRLKVKSRHIAVILNVSTVTLRKRKSRLKADVFGLGSEVSLDDWLLSGLPDVDS